MRRFLYLYFSLAVVWSLCFLGVTDSCYGQSSTPWRTAQGRACINAWMQMTISRLNSSDLGANYNSSKPWRFNRYGLLLGRTSYSNYAPDLFNRYENVQHWVWAHYNRNAYSGLWTGSLSFLNRANIPSCQGYVNSCLAQQGFRGGGGSSQGARYSFQSYNYPAFYIRHRYALGEITRIVSTLDKKDASFRIVPGLADRRYISFESVNYPGYYLRHQGFRIKLHKYNNSALFKKDATFRKRPGLANGSWISFESYNYPGRYIRHRNYHLYLEGGNTVLFRKDATFKIVRAWW